MCREYQCRIMVFRNKLNWYTSLAGQRMRFEDLEVCKNLRDTCRVAVNLEYMFVKAANPDSWIVLTNYTTDDCCCHTQSGGVAIYQHRNGILYFVNEKHPTYTIARP